jgi:hypothetical protein
VTLLVSILALLAAAWAANETRETRLDTRRMLLRSEAQAILIESRSTLHTFNCYGLVKGAEFKGKDEAMKFIEEQENQVRQGLIGMWDYSSSALTAYEKSLNTIKGDIQNTFYEKMIIVRNSWDKDLREKVDSVCKL